MQKKSTVLIVEDDALLREMYKDALTNQGFGVVLAENGREMFDQMEKYKVDLISLDIVMPVMDGFDSLRKIKKERRHDTTPIIVCSNLEHDDDKREVFALGANEYFVKSKGTPDDLIAIIKKYLAESEK